MQRRVRDVVKCPIFDAEFTTVLPVSRILLATEEENRHLSPSAFNNESGDGRTDPPETLRLTSFSPFSFMPPIPTYYPCPAIINASHAY